LLLFENNPSPDVQDKSGPAASTVGQGAVDQNVNGESAGNQQKQQDGAGERQEKIVQEEQLPVEAKAKEDADVQPAQKVEEEESQEEPQKGMFWVDGNGQAAWNIPDKGGGGDAKRPQELNVSGKGGRGTISSAGGKALPPLSEFLQAARRQKRVVEQQRRGGRGVGRGGRGRSSGGQARSQKAEDDQSLQASGGSDSGSAIEVGAWRVSIKPGVSSEDAVDDDSLPGASQAYDESGGVSEYADYVHDQIDQALQHEHEQQLYLQQQLQHEHEKQLQLHAKLAQESSVEEHGEAESQNADAGMRKVPPTSPAPVSETGTAPHQSYVLEPTQLANPAESRVAARASAAAAKVLTPVVRLSVPLRNIACTCIRHQLQQFLANPSDPTYANLGGVGGGAMRITKMTALARFLAVQQPNCLGLYYLPTDIPLELKGEEEELVLIQDDFGRRLFEQLEKTFATTAEYAQIGITDELAASFSAAELVCAPFAAAAAAAAASR
jgi:hypothetical protein